MREDYTMDVELLREGLDAPMTSLPPTRPHASAVARRHWHRPCVAISLLGFLALISVAQAQISMGSAVDLALRGNPRVQSAQADVDKARAQLSEAHDAYIPSVNAGAAVGQSYGYSPYPPTLFTVTGGSLVYNSAQPFYIRSARAGIDAAQLALDETREEVSEDTTLAFAALVYDQLREQAVGQQAGFANTLVSIVQDRVNAGQDAVINLTLARLTAAQIHLVTLKAQDDSANDREHLARLIGLPAAALTVDGKLPPALAMPDLTTEAAMSSNGYANSAVASAFASAEAKQQQARGDARFRFRPQVNLFGTFSYYATFSDSFAQLQKIYQANTGQTTLNASEGAFGVQITIPIMDRTRSAKARESAAGATHALHDAQNDQMNALDAQAQLRHSLSELQAQVDVADLQQQYAQQQLDILHQQLQSGTGNPNGPQMTPEDEQKARIAERDKYLGVLDAGFQLRQTEIRLLRQTGGLIAWTKSAVSTSAPAAPVPASTLRQDLPVTATPQP